MTTGQKVGIGIGVLALVGVGGYFIFKGTGGTGTGTGGTGTGAGGVVCQDGTPGDGTARPCLNHGGIASAAQAPSLKEQIANGIKNILSGGGGGGAVTCKDGTKGNGTAQPCKGHGGIKSAGAGGGKQRN